MENINISLLDFIEKSPTAYHAVYNVGQELSKEGFTELFESDGWKLEKGKGYFVKKGGALVAFKVPEGEFKGFQIVASHTDSPAFKLKTSFELDGTGYLKFNTERYGGAVVSSWLDRPLGIAGRVVVREGNRLSTKLVSLDKNVAVIPSVAPHLTGREELKLSLAVDFFALAGASDEKGKLLSLIADSIGVERENIISHDLFLVNREKGTLFGLSDEFLSSPRLDDLHCVYTSLLGFLKSKKEKNIPVLALFNSEEVGNSSPDGASSPFLDVILERVSTALGFSKEDFLRLIYSSFIVSADNAHAVHPNHPELTDGANSASLNGGIVIKHNANMRYITDSEGEAVFGEICRRAKVPTCHYSNRSDIAGGTTLGNTVATRLSVIGVDIGLPELAMHTAFETAGARDTEYALKVFQAFFSSHIKREKDGFMIV